MAWVFSFWFVVVADPGLEAAFWWRLGGPTIGHEFAETIVELIGVTPDAARG